MSYTEEVVRRTRRMVLSAVIGLSLTLVFEPVARPTTLGQGTGAGTAAPTADRVAPAEPERPSLEGRWPGFRNLNRDGISPETGLLGAWPEDGPHVVWRAAGGVGYSGIAVDLGRAVTMWQEGGVQLLVAFDAVNGDVLWKHDLGPGFSSPYGDGPRSTPVIDEGRVFAIDARGHLAAVRADDGRLLWSHDLEERFGARIPSIGYASTPLLEGDSLLVEVGAPQAAFMAFDKASGEPIWSSQSDEPAYVSPIALTVGGERQVVFFSARGLFALAPKDGRLLWHQPWSAPCPSTGIPLNAASPVFMAPDRLFASAAWGDHKGGATFRIVERQDGLTVEKLWHTLLIDGEISTAVHVDGHLYGFKGSILVAVNATTGEAKWSARGFGRGSLIAADGKLIVLGEDGRLALVAARPDEYRELASTRILSGRSWTSPSLAGGRLFLRNAEELVSVDLVNRVGFRESPALR